jgi:hypothetical protein
MKNLLIFLAAILICSTLISCDEEPQPGSEKSILNNIDYNIAIQNQKIDDLNSKLDRLNSTLSNIDNNIVIVSNRNMHR